MAEIINKYETIFVLDVTLDEEKITALTEKFKASAYEEKSLKAKGIRLASKEVQDITIGE